VPATRVLLVRHALCDHVGRVLAGRAPGIALNEEGRAQAERVGAALAAAPLAAIHSSPMQRARETAAAMAAHHGVPVAVHAGLDEVDVGAWTGLSFADLEADPHWRGFNERRSSTTPPGGEAFADVQARAVAAVQELARAHAGSTIALVSHADVIRSIIVHVLGMPADNLLRFDVAPASVSTLAVDGDWLQLLELNRTW
jgi:ribonuclease H / adenosylcobalamin/alpha-ribazole phosphatase